MQTVFFLLGSYFFALVAFLDLRTRSIPNRLPAAIAALGLLRVILAGDMTAALYTIVASAAVFAATFLLFWRGLLGGGDVKLMASTSLLIGYNDLLPFLFVMSVCGGFVALAVLARDRLGPRPAPFPAAATPDQEHQQPRARLTVPYGVAIAIAAIFTLLVRSSVSG